MEASSGWVLAALALAAAWVLLTARPSQLPVDVDAYVGRPYGEAVAAIKAGQPGAEVVVYRARRSWGGPRRESMAMRPGVHYLGVGSDGALLGAVPAQYAGRSIKHLGIVGVF